MRLTGAVLVLSSGCFFSLEAGVAVPVSGPVDKAATTTVEVAVGLAYDFDVALVAAGASITVVNPRGYTERDGKIFCKQ